MKDNPIIYINRITPQTVEVFTPADISMGFVNEYEFNDLRVQIATYSLDGYYVWHNNEKLYIDKHGRLPDWGNGLFDLIENQLCELFKATR
jgi:hypothetical protein